MTTSSGTIFVNPGSGPAETSVEEMRLRFPGHLVQECPPEGFADAINEAKTAGPVFIGAAGGDGTIRTVAQELVGTDIPLLVIPAGTRNHFAKDIGIKDLDGAEEAAKGRVMAVDVGSVNGHYFVNNSSIGVYPKVVIRRELHQRRLRKGVANVVAAWEQLREGGRVTVEVDGATHEAWMVFVGNGRYGTGLLDLADRESLDDGLLDIRVVLADHPFSRMRIVGALLFGRLERSPVLIRRQETATTVVLNRVRVEVALDGEVETIKTPLHYRCHQGALKVLVPMEDQ